MFNFFFSRVSTLIATFIGVSIVSFSLIRLVPGDPVLTMLGERGANPEAYNEIRQSLGLDQPIIIQYFKFIGNAFSGDLGESIVTSVPVVEEFFARFPATLELGLSGLLWAILLGVPMGIVAAVKKNSVFDYVTMSGALIGYSMPIFWWGLILIMWFSVGLDITPVSGRIDVLYEVPHVTGFLLIDTLLNGNFDAFISAVRHLILPAIVLGTIPLAVIARMTRSSMLEILSEDYIRTAKAKGLSEKRVIFVHGLRNALIPVVTVIGLMFGSIITGAILTETIFSWPGIGKWLVNSVTSRDYPVVQGGILIIAGFIVLTNITVDFVYAVVNPKVRGEG